MRKSLSNRLVQFRVEDGCLVRTVASSDGRAYSHRCAKETLEKAAHALAETPSQGEGTSLLELAQQEHLAFTQVNVALEFLKERGLVEVRHRRSYPATTDPYLDAMIEYHALAHGNASAPS